MELKTNKETNKYIKGLNRLIVRNKNKPCIYWQCNQSLEKECDKAPCTCCIYYACYCCIRRDKCVLDVLEADKEYESWCGR